MQNKKHFDQLDGVRAWLMALVVASHTSAFGLWGQGGLAVACFFTLTGFLLVTPWCEDGEERFWGIKKMMLFYLKKAIRLLIPYYIVLFTTYWIAGAATDITGDLFFTNSTGHFWFLQQEVVFYLMAPFFMIFIYLLKKYLKCNNIVIAFLLGILVPVAKKIVALTGFALQGNGKPLLFLLHVFLIGMCFGYLYKLIRNVRIKNKAFIFLADIVEVLILIASVFSASYWLSRFNEELINYSVGWELQIPSSIVFAVFLVLILINEDGIVSKLFRSKIAVFAGKMSFGVYLSHFFLIGILNIPTENKKFILIYILSTGVAYLMNTAIEKPIQKIVRKYLE